VRRLIVNADDFGLTAGVNRAITEAHSCGIVTSTTLMANGTAFDDAVKRAISDTSLAVGCHIVLVDGLPVLDPSQIPSLAGQPEGQFDTSLLRFALRVLRGEVRPEHIEAEATAQIRKLQGAGIAVSHLDTHKHTHIFPAVLDPLLSAAKACGVSAIRNPFGRMAFSQIVNRPGLWKRYGQVRLLNAWAGRFRERVAAAGLATTDGSLGIVATGEMDPRLLRLILENLPEGSWELVCHPGYNDADLDQVRTRLRRSREIELAMLTAEETRKSLAQHGVELVSYRSAG